MGSRKISVALTCGTGIGHRENLRAKAGFNLIHAGLVWLMKKMCGDELRDRLDKGIKTPLKLSRLPPATMKKVVEEKTRSFKRGRKP
jgi:hypothetical protein